METNPAFAPHIQMQRPTRRRCPRLNRLRQKSNQEDAFAQVEIATVQYDILYFFRFP